MLSVVTITHPEEHIEKKDMKTFRLLFLDQQLTEEWRDTQRKSKVFGKITANCKYELDSYRLQYPSCQGVYC